MPDLDSVLGGYPGLGLILAIAYYVGPAVGAVVEFFVNITSGQATLLVGLLGLLLQLYRMRREARGKAGND